MSTGITTLVIFLAVLLAGVSSQTSTACNDLDTAACHLMASQRPDLCSDPVLAKSACRKFCKLCPVTCYHCNNTLGDVKQCNTIKVCADDEVCMKKELKSYADGHHAYQLSCESKQLCDGLTVSFGKRHVESRDVYVTCCGSDLCNSALPVTTTAVPMTTTPSSACRKDIIILVDDSHGHDSHIMKQFLDHLTDRLPIGLNDVLVSVGKFTDHVNILWNLDTYTSKDDLDHAISNSHFYTSHDHVNLDVALKYLLSNTTSTGNRANAEDIVFLMTHHGHNDDSLLNQFHAAYPEVFVSHGHNGHLSETEYQAIASDSSHVIRWYHVNPAVIYHQLAEMICS